MTSSGLRTSIRFHIAKGIVTGFYVGLIRKAPGTWASLVATVLTWMLHPILTKTQDLSGQITACTLLVLFALSIKSITLYESYLKTHDPPEIVIDEYYGQFLCLILFKPDLLTYFMGFVLFRLFDITKPGFIGQIDRTFKGAWGTMLDDLVSGIVAGGALYLIQTLMDLTVLSNLF